MTLILFWSFYFGRIEIGIRPQVNVNYEAFNNPTQFQDFPQHVLFILEIWNWSDRI